MSTRSRTRSKKRRYVSDRRQAAAAATRARVLESARDLFGHHGVDAVTIADIARKAGVAVPTIYARYKSKAGVLRALMEAALFGPRFRSLIAEFDRVSDGVTQLTMTAAIARAIYDGESAELGLMRGVSGFSPELREVEQRFEQIRLDRQKERIRRLFAEGKAKKGLNLEKARRLLWMLTSRDVYRMLVHEGGWTPDEYETWLGGAIVRELIAETAQ